MANLQPSILLLLLEQHSRGQLVRRTLKKGFPRHAAAAVADFDADASVDFVVGAYLNGRANTACHVAV